MSLLPANMPRVLISSNPWKTSLGSAEVNHEIETVLHQRYPHWQLQSKPLSDGGDGFLDAVVASNLAARRMRMINPGPLPGQRLVCEYLWSAKEKTLFLEAAEFHGMRRMPYQNMRRMPYNNSMPYNKPAGMQASSYAVGKALMALHQQHPNMRHVVLTVGGSASTDGGAGLLQALGWRFYDHQNRLIRRTMSAEQLLTVARVEPVQLPEKFPTLTLLTDVESRYKEAPSKFGPQKGITSVQVRALEKAFDRMASLLNAQKTARQAGSGAAGGLGFAVAVAGFREFSMQSGMDWVVKNTGLDKAIATADLIITGEGRFDQTSLLGKGPGYLLAQAKKNKIPVLVLCGQNTLPLKTRLGQKTEILPLYPSAQKITRAQLTPAATRKRLRAVLKSNLETVGAMLNCQG